MDERKKETMNPILKTVRAALPGLVMLALFTGCGESPQTKLLGKWQEIGKDQDVVEFFADGTFSLKPGQVALKNLPPLTGKWVILPDGRIKVDVSMLGVTNSKVGKLEFVGEEMILTDESGPARHRRVK